MKKYEAIQKAITEDAKIRHIIFSENHYIYYCHYSDQFKDQNDFDYPLTTSYLFENNWEIYHEPEQQKYTEEEMKAAKDLCDLCDLVEYKNSEDITTASVREIVFLAKMTTEESFKSFLKKAIMVIAIMIIPMIGLSQINKVSNHIISETEGFISFYDENSENKTYVIKVSSYHNFELVSSQVNRAIRKLDMIVQQHWTLQKEIETYTKIISEKDGSNNYIIAFYPKDNKLFILDNQ